MKLLHWNCQGLRSLLTIPHIKDVRKSHAPDIMLLVETKNVNSQVKNLAKELGYQNSKIVPTYGSSSNAVFSGMIGLRSVSWITIFYIVPIYLLKKHQYMVIIYIYIYIYRNPVSWITLLFGCHIYIYIYIYMEIQ